MKPVTKTITIIAAALCALSVAGCGEKQAQIGYFNTERVMQESPQLTAIADEGNKKMAELQQKIIELQSNPNNLAEEELMKEFQKLQLEMQNTGRLYSERLREKVDAQLGEISTQKKLDVVLDNVPESKTVILGGVDVTDDIIAKLQ